MDDVSARLNAFNAAVASVRDGVLTIQSVADLFSLADQVAEFSLNGSFDTTKLQGAPASFDPGLIPSDIKDLPPVPTNDPPNASAQQEPDPTSQPS